MRSVGHILVVDDDPPIVQLITEVLEDEGYTVRTAFNTHNARAAIGDRCPDLVLIDLTMPGQGGDALARDLKNDGLADIPIILMTADNRAAHELALDGIVYLLLKPFDLDELVECVAKHIRRDSMAV